jgi:hypothetical protein
MQQSRNGAEVRVFKTAGFVDKTKTGWKLAWNMGLAEIACWTKNQWSVIKNTLKTPKSEQVWLQRDKWQSNC